MKVDDDILSEARVRFSYLEKTDRHNRDKYKENVRFVYNIDNGQWPDDVQAERKQQERSCFTSDKLRVQVAHVANNERLQRIAGNVRPVDDKGDVVTAEIISGIIRHIEHSSNAELIYIKGGECAIAGNVGYWRIVTKYLPDSFDQELLLVPIKDPMSVYLDPDRRFGFIRTKIGKKQFASLYPKAVEENFEMTDEDRSMWYDEESVYIAEYFYKERNDYEIVQLINDITGETVDIQSNALQIKEMESQGWRAQKRRKTDTEAVKWCKITASQVLEKGEWVGDAIPIIEVQGDWVWLNGKLYKRALIEGAKDDQRLYNYWKTSATEKYALANKAPYLVTDKMIEGNENAWANAHKRLYAYIKFKFDKGMSPRREPPPQMDSGSAAMLEICRRDIHDAIGRSEAGLGQRSNERSSVAINARANKADLASFHFPDNFRQAILETVRQLIQAIPKVYDGARIQRIIGEDGQHSFVPLNQDIETQNGDIYRIELNSGKYDVVEDVKIMSTRRQEVSEEMRAFSQGSPQLQLLLAPEIAKLQDWPGATKFGERLQQLLPGLLGIKQQEEEPVPEGG